MVAATPQLPVPLSRPEPGRHRKRRSRGEPFPARPAAAVAEDEIPTVEVLIAGRYRLSEPPQPDRIGQPAHDVRLQRPVTLTFLTERVLRDRLGATHRAAVPDLLAMASVVEHPALARMLDVGDDDALARTFLVTDRIDSVALSDADVEALPPEVVDAITWQLADALRYLHERGLGHACIRAANVQLSRTAAVDHQGGLFVRLGLLGLYDLRAGRPGPANGPASAPDSRADDVYDLGVLLAEAFGPQAGTGSSGWFPFRRGGDPSWNALIAAMMSPDPAARPAAADVSAAARAVTGLVSSGRSGGRS